jgi:hypothetical protein
LALTIRCGALDLVEEPRGSSPATWRPCPWPRCGTGPRFAGCSRTSSPRARRQDGPAWASMRSFRPRRRLASLRDAPGSPSAATSATTSGLHCRAANARGHAAPRPTPLGNQDRPGRRPRSTPHQPAPRLGGQPAPAQAGRRGVRLDQDHRRTGEAEVPGTRTGRLVVPARGGRLDLICLPELLAATS